MEANSIQRQEDAAVASAMLLVVCVWVGGRGESGSSCVPFVLHQLEYERHVGSRGHGDAGVVHPALDAESGQQRLAGDD